MARMKTYGRGFTLIELLIVIAIIGILSSVVLASLNNARLKSRDTKRIADIKQLQLSLALYFDSNSVYPATLAPLAPTYIPVLPSDPLSSTANICTTGAQSGCYKYIGLGSGSCSSYHLGATLEGDASTQPALNGDSDAAASGTVCTGSATPDFSGADPVYDVKP